MNEEHGDLLKTASGDARMERSIERSIESIEEELKQVRVSWSKYQSNPGKYQPQLGNATQSLLAIVSMARVALRLIEELGKTASTGDLLKTARFEGTPDGLIAQAKKLVKTLLDTRVAVRELGDELSDVTHDATGITFNLYKDQKVTALQDFLYNLDRDLGPAYEKVEDILPILKRGIKTAEVHTAALVLWQYTDEDGKDFYLAEKKLGSIKSPYTGKTFTAKPSKFSMANVGKELKEDGAKAKNALWKYTDGDSKEFWLPARVTGTIKSPWTGKGFTGKPVKENLTGVAKELKEEAKKASLDLFALTQGEEQQGQGKEASLDLFALTQEEEGQDKTAAGAESVKEYLQGKIKGWKDGDSADLSDLARGYRGKYQDLESAAKALGKLKVIKFDGSKVTKLASEQAGQEGQEKQALDLFALTQV
jgi:hypothetical protein